MAETEVLHCHWEECPYADRIIDRADGYVGMLKQGYFHRDCFVAWDKDQLKQFGRESYLGSDENLGDA